LIDKALRQIRPISLPDRAPIGAFGWESPTQIVAETS